MLLQSEQASSKWIEADQSRRGSYTVGDHEGSCLNRSSGPDTSSEHSRSRWAAARVRGKRAAGGIGAAIISEVTNIAGTLTWSRGRASRLFRPAALALAGVMSLGACGWTSEPAQPVRVTAAVELPNAGDHPLVAGWIADGEVTADELTEAYGAYIDCLEAAGMEGKYTYDVGRMGPGVAMEYNMPGDGPDGGLTDRVERHCQAQYVTPVERLYTDPLAWEDREDARRQTTIECLIQVDPTLSAIPDSDSLTTLDSPLYEQTIRSGDHDSPIAQCIETLGVGWTEFQPVG